MFIIVRFVPSASQVTLSGCRPSTTGLQICQPFMFGTPCRDTISRQKAARVSSGKQALMSSVIFCSCQLNLHVARLCLSLVGWLYRHVVIFDRVCFTLVLDTAPRDAGFSKLPAPSMEGREIADYK